MVSLPKLSGIDLQRALRRRGVAMATPAALAAHTEAERRNSVVILQDAFTSPCGTQVVLDLCELLKRLVFKVWMAPFRANGKPQHVLGMQGRFRRTTEANVDMLAALAATGVDLIGADPSMTLAYRAEYTKALAGRNVPTAQLPQEWLLHRLDALRKLDGEPPTSWVCIRPSHLDAEGGSVQAAADQR